MALWIVSYPDGTKTQSRNAKGRVWNPGLCEEQWLVDRLNSHGEDAAKRLLGRAPALGAAALQARCLVKVSHDGAEHYRGFHTRWPRECETMLSTCVRALDEPRSYSLSIEDTAICQRQEILARSLNLSQCKPNATPGQKPQHLKIAAEQTQE